MSLLREPKPAVLMFGLMYRDAALYETVKQLLSDRYGAIGSESDRYDFSGHSPYYDSEMGAGIQKRLIAVRPLFPRADIVEAKQYAVELEHRFSSDGKRAINIDPGLISEENFILSTGKNFSHRVYLRNGVYAEVTLLFVKGNKIQELPWTYRDYLKEPARSWLLSVRAELLLRRQKER